MVDDTSRWDSYDEAAHLLGLSLDETKRLTLRRGWPRRRDPTGKTLVSVPNASSLEGGDDAEENFHLDRPGACPLLVDLELRMGRLIEELAGARKEVRGVLCEAESLHVGAGRAAVLAALVEAESARSAEIRAERNHLADELARDCRPSRRCLVETLFAHPHARLRPL